ncbi:MAG: asparagine synthase-related protein, partial [Caldimicrobium sp.]
MESILLRGPITGGNPLYIYLSPKKDYLNYSEDLKSLLNASEVIKPLEINNEGISFLLQSGIIPTPYTIFKNLFVLSMGDEVIIEKKGNEILNLKFFHTYYYFHWNRKNEKKGEGDYFLNLLKEAILKRLITDKEIFLFHSAGKDSNIIALALAESEVKDKVICLTLKGPPNKDESPIAKELAIKMGFKHITFELPNKITNSHIDFLRIYFKKMILPCTDGVSLVYPFYAMEFDFKGVNLLDGSGVDVFAGHVPRKIEYQRQKVFTKLLFLRPLAEMLPTGNPLQKITLTKSEWIGLNGFTYLDTKKIFPRAKSVYKYWKEEDKKRKDWDYFDLKGDIWATYVEYGNVMRKVRILAEFCNANLIFPFTDENVAKYLATLCEKESFDRKTFKNKLFFRKILKEKLNFDVDKVRKFSYPLDTITLLKKMENYVKEEIFSCKLWDKKGIEKIFSRLLKEVDSKKASKSKRATNLILRLFLIS